MSNDFYIFCKNHKLDEEKPRTWEFYQRQLLGLPWGEEKLDLDCDDCGKSCFKSVGTTRWRCIYCGKTGEIEGAIELTEGQQEAEKLLAKEKRAENQAKALKIWDQCVPIGSNTTVLTYLGARRLELPPDYDAVMRWHERCPFGPRNTEPCIVSLFRSAATDEPTGIHRTGIISASSGESERRAYGQMFGSVIKLWPLASGGKTLTIGEGIETVLAAVKLGVGSPPAWAATVANNLGRLPIIPGVERLTILADNDEKKMGEQAARELRRRWMDRGRAVVVKIPTDVGVDFNDIVRGQS